MAQRLRQIGRQHELVHPRGAAVLQPLHCQPGAVSNGRQAAGDAQRITHGLAGFELQHGGLVDAADEADLDAHRPDVDHIAGLHDAIGRPVALEQQVVQVERGQQLIAAAQLDVAKAARGCRATGAHQHAHHGGQAADCVGARLDDKSRDEYPHAAQLSHHHAGLEVLERGGHAPGDHLMQIAVTHARDLDRANSRQRDPTIAVDLQPQVGLDRAPQVDQQLIAG